MILSNLFGFPVTAYGVAIAVGAFLSVLLLRFCFRDPYIKKGSAETFALLAIPLCLIGARLFYCLLRFDFVLNDVGPMFFFRFREGGFVLYGAVAFGVIAAHAAARASGQKALDLMDRAAPAAALMIAVSRFAEGFAGQGYARFAIEGDSLLRFIPLCTYRPLYDEWYVSVYLFEGLASACLCVYLLTRRTPHAGSPGDRTMTLLLYYAALQVFFESVREDEVLRWGFVRCSQVLSAIVLAIVLIWFLQRYKGRKKLRVALLFSTSFLALLGVCMLMEFVREQKVSFLMFMTEPMCYAVMLAALLLLTVLIRVLRRMIYLHECGTARTA